MTVFPDGFLRILTISVMVDHLSHQQYAIFVHLALLHFKIVIVIPAVHILRMLTTSRIPSRVLVTTIT